MRRGSAALVGRPSSPAAEHVRPMRTRIGAATVSSPFPSHHLPPSNPVSPKPGKTSKLDGTCPSSDTLRPTIYVESTCLSPHTVPRVTTSRVRNPSPFACVRNFSAAFKGAQSNANQEPFITARHPVTQGSRADHPGPVSIHQRLRCTLLLLSALPPLTRSESNLFEPNSHPRASRHKPNLRPPRYRSIGTRLPVRLFEPWRSWAAAITRLSRIFCFPFRQRRLYS